MARLDMDSAAGEPLGLPVMPEIAPGDLQAAFVEQSGNSGHADSAYAHEMNPTAFGDQAFGLVDSLHGYSPATCTSRSANRSAALDWTRFFMAVAIRSSRSGFCAMLTI